jgi:DtxR family Mn-dependent transcriptional regulator
MTVRNDLSESLENYLEVILDLEQNHKVARAKDIADRLQLQRGSVTSALKSLADKGLINYQPYSLITLTAKGKKLAREITGRHALLKEFLIKVLQVDAETAENTACRLEHAVDPQTVERLSCFMKYITSCPRTNERWIQSMLRFCEDRHCLSDDCRSCIDSINISG